MESRRGGGLAEQNFGSFKTELVTGLCTNSSARSIHSNDTVLTTKRAVSLFKFIYAYLIRHAYIKGMQLGCQKCVTGNGEHSCRELIQDESTKRKHFYFYLHAIDKNSLIHLFTQCVAKSGMHLTPLCLCVLHYKCLTIWRPLMRKQFLSGKAPNGISKLMCQIFFSVAQEWEMRETHVQKLTCISC